MYIKKSSFSDFGGYELDPSAVELRSITPKAVRLPYSGPLPDGLHPSSSYISFNVQINRGPRIVLAVTSAGGSRQMLGLELTKDEVVTVLDRFFAQDDNGLTPYWLGVWQANYIAWRKAAANPLELLEVLLGSPAEDRAYIASRLIS